MSYHFIFLTARARVRLLKLAYSSSARPGPWLPLSSGDVCCCFYLHIPSLGYLYNQVKFPPQFRPPPSKCSWQDASGLGLVSQVRLFASRLSHPAVASAPLCESDYLLRIGGRIPAEPTPSSSRRRTRRPRARRIFSFPLPGHRQRVTLLHRQ